MFSELQPFARPELDELVNVRIDVLYPFYVGAEEMLRWCQGKVEKICKEEKTSCDGQVGRDAGC